MSSRLLLFLALVVCIGCGSAPAPKAEEATPPAKVDQAKAEPLPAVHVDTAGGSAPGVPPEVIQFESSYGRVAFTHKKHFDRVNGDCATCHPKIFPQALAALDYGKSRHRVAEEYKTSCAACHGISGTAFAAERNCQKCHDMSTKH